MEFLLEGKGGSVRLLNLKGAIHAVGCELQFEGIDDMVGGSKGAANRGRLLLRGMLVRREMQLLLHIVELGVFLNNTLSGAVFFLIWTALSMSVV